MPTTVSITIEDADLARVSKAILARASGEPANAKAALIAIVREWVIQDGRRETVITPPSLI